MALKMLKKAERPKLPEGADRFLWTEVPVPVKKPGYAKILKGEKPRLDKRI